MVLVLLILKFPQDFFFFFFAFSFDDRSIQVCGILGQPSSCHFSSMIPIQIGPMTKENPFLTFS